MRFGICTVIYDMPHWSYIFSFSDNFIRKMQKTRPTILASLLNIKRILQVDLFAFVLFFSSLLTKGLKRWNQ